MSRQDALRPVDLASLSAVGTTRRRGEGLGYTAASTALLAIAFHVENASFVGLFALVPWLHAVERAGRIEAAALGGALGVGYGMASGYWIPDALQGLGAPGWASLAGWLVVCIWASTPVFVALAVVARAVSERSSHARVAALCTAVFGVEWVVSTAWWGVPWNLLGYSQRGAPGIAQLAVVAGVPGISVLPVGANTALGDALQHRPRRGCLSLALVAAWGALAFAGLPAAHALRPPASADASVDLLLIQPDLPRGERWIAKFQGLNLQRVQRFVEHELASEEPGIGAILLPENLLTTPLDEAPELENDLRKWVDGLQIPVLTGLALDAADRSPLRYRSAVAWLEPGRGLTQRLDKERAIPLLESTRRFPGDSALAHLFGDAARWRKVEDGAGTEPLSGPVPVTPLLCYEVLFPALAAKRHTRESHAIVNLADDSWVQGEAATHHLSEIARFRAIEQRSTLVRVAHGGWSLVVDPFGRITESLPLDRYASLRVAVRPQPPPTLGERAGLLALPIGAGVLVWWLSSALGRVSRRTASTETRP